ncbi:hypothetical protein FKM82_023083 [Ascaphus truei]
MAWSPAPPQSEIQLSLAATRDVTRHYTRGLRMPWFSGQIRMETLRLLTAYKMAAAFLLQQVEQDFSLNIIAIEKNEAHDVFPPEMISPPATLCSVALSRPVCYRSSNIPSFAFYPLPAV